MRTKKEILKELETSENKVWYDRHQMLMEKVYPKEKDPKVIKNIKAAIKSAKEMEKKYGRKNLKPMTDIEWGKLLGRLETLRWILGDNWGNFDS